MDLYSVGVICWEMCFGFTPLAFLPTFDACLFYLIKKFSIVDILPNETSLFMRPALTQLLAPDPRKRPTIDVILASCFLRKSWELEYLSLDSEKAVYYLSLNRKYDFLQCYA